MAEPNPSDGGARTLTAGLASVRQSRPWRFVRGHGILVALLLLVCVGAILSPFFLTPGNLGQRGPPGLHRRDPRRRHDVRHPHRRHRPLGRIDRRASRRSPSPRRWRAACPGRWRCSSALAGRSAGRGASTASASPRDDLQPFVMTLGMLVIARGVTMTYRRRQADPARRRGRRSSPGSAPATWLGLPVPVCIFALIATVAWFTLRYTPFGRQVYAVGDNLEAARLSGINTNRVIFSVYVISGLCAAVTALIIVVAADGRRAQPGHRLRARRHRHRRHRRHQPVRRRGWRRRHAHRRGDRGGHEQPAQPPGCLAVLPADRQGPDHPRRRPARTADGRRRRGEP